MKKRSGTSKGAADKLARGIKRKTRKHNSAEGENRSATGPGEGSNGPHLAGWLARRRQHCRVVPSRGDRSEPLLQLVEGFLEASKKRLAGDTAREASTGEVKTLRREARDLKEVVAEQALEIRLLKKRMIGDGEDDA